MACYTRTGVLYMDAALKHLHIPRPTPTTNLRRRQPPLHIPTTHLRFYMPFPNQSLTRIFSAKTNRLSHQTLFCIKNITMADQENRGTQLSNVDTNDTEKQAEEKEKNPSESIPPPPEKPLAGDCCGSGCVRCVWDVYYDDLEDYNKLYVANKAGSKS